MPLLRAVCKSTHASTSLSTHLSMYLNVAYVDNENRIFRSIDLCFARAGELRSNRLTDQNASHPGGTVAA